MPLFTDPPASYPDGWAPAPSRPAAVYGFRFDRDAEGVFYVKQRAENGDMIALPDVAQDRRRFATWQEAKVPAEKWERAANDPRILPVCNPQYQERRLDGVMAHLENDPRTGGTVLVRDTDCRLPPCPVRSGIDGRPCTLAEGHDGCHMHKEQDR